MWLVATALLVLLAARLGWSAGRRATRAEVAALLARVDAITERARARPGLGTVDRPDP